MLKERDLKAAKRHRQSKIRQDLLEKGLRAMGALLLESLGELKPESEEIRNEAISAVRLAVEVLDGTP